MDYEKFMNQLTTLTMRQKIDWDVSNVLPGGNKYTVRIGSRTIIIELTYCLVPPNMGLLTHVSLSENNRVGIHYNIQMGDQLWLCAKELVNSIIISHVGTADVVTEMYHNLNIIEEY